MNRLLTPLRSRRPDDRPEQTNSRRDAVSYDADGNPRVADPAALARAIVRAAAKARNELPPDEAEAEDLPTDATARAVVLAGKKRRNEIPG